MTIIVPSANPKAETIAVENFVSYGLAPGCCLKNRALRRESGEIN